MTFHSLRLCMSSIRRRVLLCVLAGLLVIAFSQYIGGRQHYPTWFTTTTARTNYARYALDENDTEFTTISMAYGLGHSFSSKDETMPKIIHRALNHLHYDKSMAQLKQQPKTGGPHIILILAYMHTGSTYLGELFQQHLGSFYLFEPLRSLKSKAKSNQMINYLDGRRFPLNETFYTTVGAQSVIDMFSCDFRKLDVGTLLEKYISDRIRGRDTESFNRCVDFYFNRFNHRQPREHKPNIILRTQPYANLLRRDEVLNMCLPNFMMKCENSNIRVIKMIRMNMDMTELALQKLPNFRIIHLLRDPRAMIDSNARRGELNVTTFDGCRQRASYMCNRMTEDLKASERLKRLYPGQIFTLQYEEMVKNPMDIARKLHEYVQIPFTSSIKKFVQRKSIDAIMNSTVLANAWRKHIIEHQLKIIEYECHDLFEMLGYNKLYTLTNVRNATLPSYTKLYDP